MRRSMYFVVPLLAVMNWGLTASAMPAPLTPPKTSVSETYRHRDLFLRLDGDNGAVQSPGIGLRQVHTADFDAQPQPQPREEEGQEEITPVADPTTAPKTTRERRAGVVHPPELQPPAPPRRRALAQAGVNGEQVDTPAAKRDVLQPVDVYNSEYMDNIEGSDDGRLPVHDHAGVQNVQIGTDPYKRDVGEPNENAYAHVYPEHVEDMMGSGPVA